MLKTLFFAWLSMLGTAALAAVDVNQASQAELESVKGIGPAMSERILGERKKRPFKDWPDFIVRVKGLGANQAVRFSAEGLTVNGAAFSDRAAATRASAPAAK